MPRFEIEQYEVWLSKTVVEADDMNEAIRKLLDGEGEPVDNSSEYIETDETRGMPTEMALELGIAIDLDDDILDEEWGISTIRSIEQTH